MENDKQPPATPSDGQMNDLLPIDGIDLRTGRTSGRNRDHLLVMKLAEATQVAAVFTQSSFRAPPVIIAERNIKQVPTQALLVNAGNANAATGDEGYENAEALCGRVARALNINPAAVLPFSTGVIGEQLPVAAMSEALEAMCQSAEPASFSDAACAIMTTDTVPKGTSARFSCGGETYSVTGIAKGVGMICPNMATMLAYIATDATVAKADLDIMLREIVEQTFNRISVDGDTSTNDACLLLASGQKPSIKPENACWQPLYDAVYKVAQHLAHSIVKDGEGATKFVTINIEGGHTRRECLDVGYSIANSPLVKTALYASDPNWGRLLMAIGNAGLKALNTNQVSIYLDDVLVFEKGQAATSYTETDGARIMQQDAFSITVLLGRGSHTERIWTCDLSHEYIRINTEYRS